MLLLIWLCSLLWFAVLWLTLEWPCLKANFLDKFYLLTFYAADTPKKHKFQRHTKRVIEATDQNDANNQASKIIKDERYEPYHLEPIPDDQVALEKKRIKDTRKLRYQSILIEPLGEYSRGFMLSEIHLYFSNAMPYNSFYRLSVCRIRKTNKEISNGFVPGKET